MKWLQTVAALLLVANVSALAHPQPIPDPDDVSVYEREQFDERSSEDLFAEYSELYKRKGGGGGGGKGGGGGSSSSGSSSSGSGGGRGGSSSSSSSSGSRGSSSSNLGGATRSGSGAPKAFGGGKYYGGGASTPYTAGGKSPAGKIAPLAIGVGVGAAVGVGAGALALHSYPGYWPYGLYSYPYYHPYGYYNRTARRNRTATSTSSSATATPTVAGRGTLALLGRQDDGTTGANESKPVVCVCAAYSVCGCDDQGDYSFLDPIIGDGTWATLNHTLVDVADVNGTSSIILNGTLPNGTTASGGTEDATSAASSPTPSPTSSVAGFLGTSGYFVLAVIVGCAVFMV
ncbi:hypothetical protein BJ875DRAFT_445835 [Amylocarpus encephaloides]|uniref:DUF7732 domain-containing protein n=1 Tax=Amylocarpus encephaloides TaxID=45428 RepID=A0A9P7Y9W8_9HELO|nr:hypothetical protein BJ875DRAFT_445835 [Amylocarpus encephaloides]